MWTVRVKAGQTELNEARGTNEQNKEITNTSRDLLKCIYILHGITKQSTSSFRATQRPLPEHGVSWPGAAHLEARTVTLSCRPNSHLKSGSEESAE